MTQLFLNDKQVYLPEKFRISIVERNPIFNESGSYSKPFVIPYEVNAHILDFPGRIEKVSRNPTYDFRLVQDGQLLLYGTAVGDGEMEDDRFPLVLLSGKSELFYSIKNKRLNEIDFGTWIVKQGLPLTEYNYSLDIDNTLGRNIPYVCAPIFRITDDDEIVWVNELSTNQTTELKSSNNFSFYFRTNWLLNRMLQRLGYNIVNFEPELFNETLLFCNRATGQSSYNVNIYENVPGCDAKDFINTVLKYEGASIFFNNNNEIFIKRFDEILNSNEITEFENIVSIYPEIRLFSDGFRLSMDGLDDGFNDDTPGPRPVVAFFENLPAPGTAFPKQIYYVEDRERYYQYKQIDEDNDIWDYREVYATRPYINGAQEETIDISVKTLQQALVEHPYFTGTFIYESLLWEGEFFGSLVSSKGIDKEIYFFTLEKEVLFYQPGTGATFNRPVSLNGRWRIPSDENGASFSNPETTRNDIRPTSPYGIRERNYKEYENWVARRKPFYVESRLSIDFLRNVRLYKKYRFGRVAGIIDTMEYTISESGIGVVKFTCWTV